MSGHSHARTVKHQKEMDAQRRSKVFSKMVRLITVAVREGGTDPEMNSKLKMAIDKAYDYNMPKENIERAIKRASGELPGGGQLEKFLFDAYGPGNVACLIEGISDNRNRAIGDIKKTLKQYNGKLVEHGAVRWMFERKGCLIIKIDEQDEEHKDKEELELLAIEAGAEDTDWREGFLDIYTSVDNLEEAKKYLKEKGVKIHSSDLEWIPKKEVDVSEKQKNSCLELFNELDENPDVQDIYSNLKV